jgi:hypothetical protein
MTYKAAATWRALTDQGKTWSKTLIYKIGGTPFDTTGWSARMMVRRNYDSTAVISLTSAPGGGITLGGSNGEITFRAMLRSCTGLCVALWSFGVR